MTGTVTPIKRKRKQYSRAEKAEIAGEAVGAGIAATAEKRGIAPRTIGQWVHHPEYAELIAKKREEVAEMFWAAVQIGVDQVTIGLLDPKVPLRDKSVALGIIYDKHALLTGGATVRTETRDVTDSLDDHEKALLRDKLREIVEAAEAVAE